VHSFILTYSSSSLATYSRYFGCNRKEIIERTNEADLHQTHQSTQLACLHDALAFLAEANTARSQHLALFQKNVKEWAQVHQARHATLEQRLAQAQEEIRKVEVQVALPTTAPPAAPMPTHLSSISGLRFRTPALQTSTPYVPQGATGANGGGWPPRAPRRPAVPPSPSPPPPESNGDDDDLYDRNLPAGRPPPGAREPTVTKLATMLRPEEIARLVGEGIAAAQANRNQKA